jgi:putative addiction module component (TIGR02574 family)
MHWRDCPWAALLVDLRGLIHHARITTVLESAMGKAELEALRSAALALSELERARLAKDLVASLDGPAEDSAAAAWDVEVCRRINEIEAGKARLFEVDEVLARARARLRG